MHHLKSASFGVLPADCLFASTLLPLLPRVNEVSSSRLLSVRVRLLPLLGHQNTFSRRSLDTYSLFADRRCYHLPALYIDWSAMAFYRLTQYNLFRRDSQQ
jgi:hypothetical protein